MSGESTPYGTINSTSRAFQELKLRIHQQLLERLDLVALSSLDSVEAENHIRSMLHRLLQADNFSLADADRDRLIEEVGDEVLGLGPLDQLLQDNDISDILVNGPADVYIEKSGKLLRTEVKFRDAEHLMQIIKRVVSAVGRRIGPHAPMVDARLPDGSRVNAIVPPLALNGPCMSIRRFGRDPYRMENLLAFGTLTQQMARYLAAIIHGRLNVVISGGTGAGKTTLLNCLTSFIGQEERVLTIEDSAELLLQQRHVVRLETRPADADGRGEVSQRNLVRNALRMRPDRIIIGEVRGGEALDMLQAMNTGHEGSITTVHANNPRDCLQRLETMVAMAGIEIPAKAVRREIGAAINVVVQCMRQTDGKRRVTKISEIAGMEGEQVQLQDVFEYVQVGVNADGTIQGHHRSTGLRTRYFEKLIAAGIPADDLLPRDG